MTEISAAIRPIPGPVARWRRILETGRKTSAALGHLFTLWVGAELVIPRLDPRRRQRVAAWFAWHTLRALDVTIRVRDTCPETKGPRLLVANHVSWLDVYALNAVLQARFVAKSETRTWPLLGVITQAFDTLFVVRESFRDAARVKDAAAAALRQGDTIVVFPEGTTTDGTLLRRFYPAFFQAAIDASVAVQPVAIRYPGDHGLPNLAAAFVDDMTFLESFQRIVGQRGLTVELTFGPAISATHRTRRELAQVARRHIADHLAPLGCAIEPQTVRARAKQPTHRMRMVPGTGRPAWLPPGERTSAGSPDSVESTLQGFPSARPWAVLIEGGRHARR